MILITGASGNVGVEVIRSLVRDFKGLRLVAGVRDLEKDKKNLSEFDIEYCFLDFTKPKTFDAALENCRILFLLRPPQLADVSIFKPFIATAKTKGVEHIVFLSVQGVEHSKRIPHHKIEQTIRESGIGWTFLRPAYFMQNFETTLKKELVERRRIFLPAGLTKFTLVDVRDVGQVAAAVLSSPEPHIGKAYDLTGPDSLTFGQMAKILSSILRRPIDFESPGLLQFIRYERSEKVPFGFIWMMILLHYFPRFKEEPQTTDWIKKITGKNPFSFNQYIVDNRNNLL